MYSSCKITNLMSEKEGTLPINAIKIVSFIKYKRKESKSNYLSRQNCSEVVKNIEKWHDISCKGKGRIRCKCSKKNSLAQCYKIRNIKKGIIELQISDKSSNFKLEAASEQLFALTCNRIATYIK